MRSETEPATNQRHDKGAQSMVFIFAEFYLRALPLSTALNHNAACIGSMQLLEVQILATSAD